MLYANQDIDEQQVIRSNIADAIRRAKRQGIVGMSYGNLKQVTNTRGVTCSVHHFHQWFDDIAAQVANDQRFELYR